MIHRALVSKFSKYVFSVTLLSFVAAPASAQAEEAMSDKDLIGALQEAFMMHFKYHGSYKKSYPDGYGVGCKKTREVEVYWNSTLKDITVSLSSEGVAQFKFDLEGSKAWVSYAGQNSFCMYKGYYGDVLTRNIRGEFHIIPQGGEKPALIDIKGLELSDLQFKNWSLFRPFFYDIEGDAPEFMNRWAQNSLNGLVKWFLKSSFSSRLDRFVSKKVNDALKDRYDGEVLQFAQVPEPHVLRH